MELQKMANTNRSKKTITELKIISINVNSIVTNQRRSFLTNLKAKNPMSPFFQKQN